MLAAVWNCEACTLENDADRTDCSACNAPKPAAATVQVDERDGASVSVESSMEDEGTRAMSVDEEQSHQPPAASASNLFFDESQDDGSNAFAADAGFGLGDPPPPPPDADAAGARPAAVCCAPRARTALSATRLVHKLRYLLRA